MRRLAALLAALLLPAALLAQTGSRECVDGEDDFISLNITSGFGINEGAIALWVALDPMSTTGYFIRVWTSSAHNVQISWDNTGNQVNFTRIGGSTNDAAVVSASEDGTWHHYAFAWSDAGDLNRYYKDGVEFDTDTGIGTWTGAPIRSRLCNSTESVTADLDGRVASLQIWNRPITAAEVAEAMRCPGSVASGLVRHLPLWDAGDTYVDLSATGVDAANSGSAASSSGPPISICAGGT